MYSAIGMVGRQAALLVICGICKKGKKENFDVVTNLQAEIAVRESFGHVHPTD